MWRGPLSRESHTLLKTAFTALSFKRRKTQAQKGPIPADFRSRQAHRQGCCMPESGKTGKGKGQGHVQRALQGREREVWHISTVITMW